MADLATPQFLEHLKAIYPSPAALTSDEVIHNPWYLVAAVTFSASNKAAAVPAVFEFTLSLLKSVQRSQDEEAVSEQLLLARRFREAILQSGLLSGIPRTINSLIALDKIMPEKLKDKKVLRDVNKHMDEFAKSGEALFRAMYGDTADSVQGLLDSAYPDLGWWCNNIGYGVTYGGTKGILTQVESSFAIVAALIAVDAPRQVGWHLHNAQNGGATLEEAKAVRRISMEIAEKAGVTWVDGVPEAL